MIILHYIPNSKLAKAQNFVSMLQVTMGKAVKMNLITGDVKRKDFLRQLATINPDIVHIHGCWQYKAARVQRWCKHRGYPVIISPHGLLSMDVISTNPWKYYAPRIAAYQFHSIRTSYLLLATSQKEFADLKELGWRKRLVLANATDPNLSDTLYALYKKVLDTNLRNQLSVGDTRALYTILNAAANAGHAKETIVTISGTDYHQQDLSLKENNDEVNLSLSASSWNAIQVYAIDHGITDLLNKGVKALGITIPEIVTTPPDRFPYHSKLKKKKSITKDNITNRYPNNPFEVEIAMNIIAIHAMTIHNRILSSLTLNISSNTLHPTPNTQHPSPIHLLHDIHQQLRWHDYDEAVLLSILSSIGIKKYTARLMYALQEAYNLPLGYMPIDPVNDHKTQQLLIKLNSQP